MKPTQNLIQLLLVVSALGVVAWLAITGDEPSRGAMLAALGTGVSWAFRGKVETPK